MRIQCSTSTRNKTFSDFAHRDPEPARSTNGTLPNKLKEARHWFDGKCLCSAAQRKEMENQPEEDETGDLPIPEQLQ